MLPGLLHQLCSFWSKMFIRVVEGFLLGFFRLGFICMNLVCFMGAT